MQCEYLVRLYDVILLVVRSSLFHECDKDKSNARCPLKCDVIHFFRFSPLPTKTFKLVGVVAVTAVVVLRHSPITAAVVVLGRGACKTIAASWLMDMR